MTRQPHGTIAGSEKGKGFFTAFLGFFRVTRGLSGTARKTFRYHISFSAAEGTFAGLFGLFGYVVEKTLNASPIQVALVTTWPIAMFALSMYWMRLIEGRDFRRSLCVASIITRGSLLIVLFFHWPFVFVAIAFLVWGTNGFASLCNNTILKSNYKDDYRGRLIGFSNSANMLMAIAAIAVASRLLNYNEMWFRYIFPAAGVIGITAHIILSLIRPVREHQVSTMIYEKDRGFWNFLTYPVRGFWRVFRSDRRYLVYEIGFFIYGTAFIMSLPVRIIFMNKYIGMTYAQIGTAELICQITIVLVNPFAGRFLDKIGAVRFTVIPFGILTVYAVCMSLSHTVAWVYMGFFLFGAGVGCLNIVWTLGPVSLAPEGRIEAYSAIHSTLVGVRACFAPVLGIWLMQGFSFQVAFQVAAALFAGGALTILVLSFFRPAIRSEHGQY